MTNKLKKPIKNMKSKVVSTLYSFLTTANANANVNVSNSTGTNVNASADMSLRLDKSTSQTVQPARTTDSGQDLDLDPKQAQDHASEVDWDTDTEDQDQDLNNQDLEHSQVMTDKLIWAEHVAQDQVNLGAAHAAPLPQMILSFTLALRHLVVNTHPPTLEVIWLGVLPPHCMVVITSERRMLLVHKLLAHCLILHSQLSNIRLR